MSSRFTDGTIHWIALVFLVFAVSCKQGCEPETQGAEFFNLKMTNTDTVNSVVVYKVSADNGNSIYDTAINTDVIALPFSPDNHSSSYLIYFDSLLALADTLSVNYDTRVGIAAPNCGLYRTFSLSDVSSTFGSSARVIEKKVLKNETRIYHVEVEF